MSVTIKGYQERDFCSDGIILYFDCSSSYVNLHSIKCIEQTHSLYQCEFPGFDTILLLCGMEPLWETWLTGTQDLSPLSLQLCESIIDSL